MCSETVIKWAGCGCHIHTWTLACDEAIHFDKNCRSYYFEIVRQEGYCQRHWREIEEGMLDTGGDTWAQRKRREFWE